MSLDIEQLRERVETHFPDFQQIDESIIRFTKKLGDRPFAVYYIDITQKLPDTSDFLTVYQDRVIGERYFEGQKSLQWSNYLYFITSADRLRSHELDRVKRLIEGDRMYARKFVISEDELDSVLTPPAVAPTDLPAETNILLTWTNLLVEAGIDKAILSNDSLPDRLRLIEDTPPEVTIISRPPKVLEAARPLPFIRTLHIKDFRDFLNQRDFTFGKVNLIFGANATGKTSLLEAIELFYCGRNKRTPDKGVHYELVADLVDGCTEAATSKRELQVFRDRNLSWYGQSEIKTNYLCRSFAQFNFLDTDAAVSLALDEDSGQRLEEDLSKLLVGADAAKTWRDIERVNEELVSRLQNGQQIKVQINGEMSSLLAQLKECSKVERGSDLIRAHLREMIHRIGWPDSLVSGEALGNTLTGPLSELISLFGQAVELDIPNAPISLDKLSKYCASAKVTIERTEKDVAHLELLRQNQGLADKAIRRNHEALELLEQLKRLINSDIPQRTAERAAKENTIATCSNWLAGFDEAATRIMSAARIETNVNDYYDASVKRSSDAEALLANAASEYADFTNLREESINLVQELRQIAQKILRSSPNPDECPLCYTRFEQGELVRHISIKIDKQFEVLGKPLLTKLEARQSEAVSARTSKAMAEWLIEFCKRADLPSNLPVNLALAEVEKVRMTLAEAQNRLEVIDVELRMLDTLGLSMERLEEISALLGELGFPVDENTDTAMNRLTRTINRSLETLLETSKTDRAQADKLKRKIEKALGLADSEIDNPRGELSRLREILAEAEFLQSSLAAFSTALPLPGGRPFAELLIEAESILKVAGELQAAHTAEMQRQSVYTGLMKRKVQLENQLTQLNPRTERLERARSVLKTIIDEYPLTAAMESALKHNRNGIETIFLNIHSPVEFAGLGPTWKTLIRKGDGSEAELNQISTGQRSAFALSVFLAQNVQLKTAPPMILMDDPIAHADDLNSLSFLDYLREIALTGKRQIFFTTASDKLASLFERKFDFLGDEFYRIDLSRDL